MFGVIVIYMATLHLAATCMSLLSTSSGLPGEPATESHTSVSATMSYNECYNVCSENGTIYCAHQGDRCIGSDTYVRSSVDQRDSAASTRTQMRQSVITGPFQATQRRRMKFIIAVQLLGNRELFPPLEVALPMSSRSLVLGLQG